MALHIYNSQARRKEKFNPLIPGKVRMYVCGVTVYDDPHIGHARCYVAFDTILRHMRALELKVTYVRNFTDIDDKIINRAHELGMDPGELAETYIKSFREDMAALGCLEADYEPRATENIQGIVAAVERLVKKGHAYEMEGGDVFFSVESFHGYGKLSGRNLEDMRAGARIEVDQRKKSPMDFSLWKASKPGEPAWDSPWGPGRPGWHIECSVMSQKHLGQTLDIHGGGEDLIFPHHENEIAQSEALTGAFFARFWIHNGFVRVDQEKMSKSLGNFFTIKEILAKVSPEVLRLFLLSKHYRAPLDFSDQALNEAAHALERLYTALLAAQEKLSAREGGEWRQSPASYQGDIGQAEQEFLNGMDDDFNTPRALSGLFALAKTANRIIGEPISQTREGLLDLCAERLRVLGLRLGILGEDPRAFLQGAGQAASGEAQVSGAEIEALIAERAQARKDNDFARADQIRDDLAASGVILQDSPQGTTWRIQR